VAQLRAGGWNVLAPARVIGTRLNPSYVKISGDAKGAPLSGWRLLRHAGVLVSLNLRMPFFVQCSTCWNTQSNHIRLIRQETTYHVRLGLLGADRRT
jgi:hypothetical protein